MSLALLKCLPSRSSCFRLIVSYSTIKADPVIGGLGKASKKKAGGAKLGAATKKLFDVETDANRLVNYVCGSNILKEGGEDIKIKDNSEYPDWLWTLRLGKAPPLEDLDPNTLEYWKRVRKLGKRRNNYLKSVRPFEPFRKSVLP